MIRGPNRILQLALSNYTIHLGNTNGWEKTRQFFLRKETLNGKTGAILRILMDTAIIFGDSIHFALHQTCLVSQLLDKLGRELTAKPQAIRPDENDSDLLQRLLPLVSKPAAKKGQL